MTLTQLLISTQTNLHKHGNIWLCQSSNKQSDLCNSTLYSVEQWMIVFIHFKLMIFNILLVMYQVLASCINKIHDCQCLYMSWNPLPYKYTSNSDMISPFCYIAYNRRKFTYKNFLFASMHLTFTVRC